MTDANKWRLDAGQRRAVRVVAYDATCLGLIRTLNRAEFARRYEVDPIDADCRIAARLEGVPDPNCKCRQRSISPSRIGGAPVGVAGAIGPDVMHRCRSPHPRGETKARPNPKFKGYLSLQPLDPVPVKCPGWTYILQVQIEVRATTRTKRVRNFERERDQCPASRACPYKRPYSAESGKLAARQVRTEANPNCQMILHIDAGCHPNDPDQRIESSATLNHERMVREFGLGW